jgi:hypothetical protein
MAMIQEKVRGTASGLAMIGLVLALMAAGALGVREAALTASPALGIGSGLFVGLAAFVAAGLFIVNPNEARVLQLFGAYRGTVRDSGLRWANPFFSKRPLSVRVRNFESSKLKVNDREGNPIEIAAIVVWRVVDTAEALFEVDNYENYIKVQSESALRGLASRYAYDGGDEEVSLRGGTQAVAADLQHEVQARLAKAGIEVMEARISHLAYAPEIAAAMLRRQQAGAIIAARQKIVEGAVGMVEMALDMLAKSDKVALDEDRKAAMVSNLLVVLCADREAQPVVNTGTLYQ